FDTIAADGRARENSMRRVAVALVGLVIGWRIWNVFQDYNADKAGVFVIIILALSALVALYRTGDKD
ncbi:hypothetical protein, partial [Salmonella enterica]|uniref:hypothetical protein n=1 Tax=Salmonella enterica TaxID=28901 RepID=UPI000AF988AD